MSNERFNSIIRTLVIVSLFAVTTAVVPARAADNDAAANFKSKCAMCHGQDATGHTAMGAKLNIRDLTSPDVQKQSDSELQTVVTKGRNKMPAYGGKLSDEQIANLVKYIRSIARK